MATISDLKRKRAEHKARVKALLTKSDELPEDQDLDADEVSELSALSGKIEALDARISTLEDATRAAGEGMEPVEDDDEDKGARGSVRKAAPAIIRGNKNSRIAPRKAGNGTMAARAVAGIVKASVAGRDAVLFEMDSYDSEAGGHVEKALASNASTGGQTTVPTPVYEGIIDLLRSRTVLDKVDPVPFDLTGAGNISIPRLGATAGASWGSENTAITTADPTLDNVSLTSKKLVSATPISRELLMRSVVNIESVVATDLVAAAARVEDLAFFTGAGSGGVPLGMATLATGAGINQRPVYADSATDGLVTTGTAMLDAAGKYLRQMVAAYENNNGAGERMFWTFHPGVKHFLANLRDGAGGYPFAAGLDAEQPRLLGIPVYNSTQHVRNIANVVASGTAGTMLYLADGAEIARSTEGGITLETTTEGGNAFLTHQMIIKMVRYTDWNYRHAQTVIVGRVNGWF